MRRLLPVLLLLAAAGCSEPPQKELDQAQAAIDAARAANADVYAADEFTAASGSFQKARDSVDQRDYRQALTYALDARQRANEAARLTVAAKTRARRDAETLLTDGSARASQLNTDLKVAAAAHVPARELRADRATLAAAQTALQEARSAIQAGNYKEAVDSLTAVRKKLDAAIRSVDELRQRPPRRGKGQRSHRASNTTSAQPVR